MGKEKKKEKIRRLENELNKTREKLEATQIHNGQEDKRVTELIKTLDELKTNYFEKIKELETIQNEYTKLNSDLKLFASTLRGTVNSKKLD